MSAIGLEVGANQRIVTPTPGISMAGWASRAAGDNKARYIHDDLYVKAISFRVGDRTAILITADLIGVDGMAVAKIRELVHKKTGVEKDAIMVCATHCHSGPVVCPVASATDERLRRSVKSDGSMPDSYGKSAEGIRPQGASVSVPSRKYYHDEVDPTWRDYFIRMSVSAAEDSLDSLKPAVVCVGAAKIEGVASSRRVLLSDGSWSDPRKDSPGGKDRVYSTEIDSMVRSLFIKDAGSNNLIAAIINYGTHPWIFSLSGISAEIPGAAAREFSSMVCAEGIEPPVILYTTAPAGDVTPIWNIDIENTWKMKKGETSEESLKRREESFDRELDRFGSLIALGIKKALDEIVSWDNESSLAVLRKEITLPLKEGYVHPEGLFLADWQLNARHNEHKTEIQLVVLGDFALLGLPGEPFVSIGRSVRQYISGGDLIIISLANDFGGFSYIGESKDFEVGGYELDHTPVAKGSGEMLIRESVSLLEDAFGRK